MSKDYDFDKEDLEDYNPEAQEVLMELRDNTLNTLKKLSKFVRDHYNKFYTLC